MKIVHLNGQSEEYEQNSGLVKGATASHQKASSSNFKPMPIIKSMSELGAVVDPEVRIIDLINELEGRIRDKIKNYMVSAYAFDSITPS